eukprot:351970-Chlamydomonas_euryale.AAC.5
MHQHLDAGTARSEIPGVRPKSWFIASADDRCICARCAVHAQCTYVVGTIVRNTRMATLRCFHFHAWATGRCVLYKYIVVHIVVQTSHSKRHRDLRARKMPGGEKW